MKQYFKFWRIRSNSGTVLYILEQYSLLWRSNSNSEPILEFVEGYLKIWNNNSILGTALKTPEHSFKF
jgi:hypothetical protein